MAFQKAERKRAKLKLAMTGPAGSGKSLSSLYLASGLGNKIAVIDTENDSASLYAGFKDVPSFDSCTIEPPYTIAKYIDAINDAVKAGYDVLIIDSISHAWAGEGGILAKKAAIDARGGNSYTNWSSLTPEQEAFKAKILNSDIHLIATMRSKQDYVLEINEKGKSAPKKVGLAPIQRDDIQYEFTTVFDVAMDHNTMVSKDRTGLFDGQTFKISKGTGEILSKWLEGGQKELYSESINQKRIFWDMAVTCGVSDREYILKMSSALKDKVDMENLKLAIKEYMEAKPYVIVGK